MIICYLKYFFIDNLKNDTFIWIIFNYTSTVEGLLLGVSKSSLGFLKDVYCKSVRKGKAVPIGAVVSQVNLPCKFSLLFSIV